MIANPERPAGWFRLSDEQHAVLAETGLALANQVIYQPPETIEVFRGIHINNFRCRFWKNSFSDDAQPPYTFEGTPYFMRFITLFPEFTEETSRLIDAYEPMATDIVEHQGRDGANFTRQQHDEFYTENIEPRLLFAWRWMGQLVDEADIDFRVSVSECASNEDAVWHMLSR